MAIGEELRASARFRGHTKTLEQAITLTLALLAASGRRALGSLYGTTEELTKAQRAAVFGEAGSASDVQGGLVGAGLVECVGKGKGSFTRESNAK